MTRRRAGTCDTAGMTPQPVPPTAGAPRRRPGTDRRVLLLAAAAVVALAGCSGDPAEVPAAAHYCALLPGDATTALVGDVPAEEPPVTQLRAIEDCQVEGEDGVVSLSYSRGSLADREFDNAVQAVDRSTRLADGFAPATEGYLGETDVGHGAIVRRQFDGGPVTLRIGVVQDAGRERDPGAMQRLVRGALERCASLPWCVGALDE